MEYAVLRYDAPFTDNQRCWFVGSFATRWEAERALRVFRDDWKTDVVGDALFVVATTEKNPCVDPDDQPR